MKTTIDGFHSKFDVFIQVLPSSGGRRQRFALSHWTSSDSETVGRTAQQRDTLKRHQRHEFVRRTSWISASSRAWCASAWKSNKIKKIPSIPVPAVPPRPCTHFGFGCGFFFVCFLLRSVQVEDHLNEEGRWLGGGWGNKAQEDA